MKKLILFVAAAFDAKWGDPKQFLSMTVTGMFRHTHKIGGIL